MAANISKHKQIDSECLPVGVFELPGEPAFVINGVPPITSCFNDIITLKDTQPAGNVFSGEWYEGRQVRKLFDGKYYSGTMTEYNKENGWYRVVYEDGDSEDLDWKEFEEVLLPLDITIPLKAVAESIIRVGQNPVNEPGATSQARSGRKSGSVETNIQEIFMLEN
ncbi:hypothetical protein ACFE04_018728 [Oxalis oulophora]